MTSLVPAAQKAPANESLDTEGPRGYNEIWIPRDPSLLTVIAIDTLVTLFVACIITAIVMWKINKRAQSREERDKLGQIIKAHYWDNEENISNVLQIFSKMKQIVIFREVTELHVLAYKYRRDNGVYGPKDRSVEAVAKPHINALHAVKPEVMVVIKKMERLFDVLRLQLPCQGKCPDNIASTFSATVYNLAQETAMIWCNTKGRLICSLVHYFAGRAAAEQFDHTLISDDDLETIVLARLPYIDQIYLNSDHFVLQEVEISSDLKIDLKNKIRYVDTVLAKNSKTLQVKEKNIIESYYSAREICLKNGFIQNKNSFPDILSKVGEPSKLGECVVYLRHLIRIMCMSKNMKKVENDDKFFQFLMLLHEALYTWSDTNTMIEIIERIRSNIYCYLKGLTIEQMLIDKEFTKAKLEHFEKELYKHLNYLTLRQVQQEKERRQFPTGLDSKLRNVESESSIYTMALSTSSFLMRQPSQEQAEIPRRPDLELLHQQRSLDQASLVSAGSSMFATAVSLGSGNDLSQGRTPPQRSSPPQCQSPPRASSPPIAKQYRCKSPQNMPDRNQAAGNLINISEYYETAV